MKNNKALAYFSIALGILFSLVTLGKLPKILSLISTLGELEAYDTGFVIGQVLAFMGIAIFSVILINYGIRKLKSGKPKS